MQPGEVNRYICPIVNVPIWLAAGITPPEPSVYLRLPRILLDSFVHLLQYLLNA